MNDPNTPNGNLMEQRPLQGEVVIAKSNVTVGLAPNGDVILVITPRDTLLNLVILMGKAEASQIGKALVAQGSGIVMP